MRGLVLSVGSAFLILIAIAYMLKIGAIYSRGWLLTWLLMSTLLLLASRPLFSALLRWLSAEGLMLRRIAIVGGGDETVELGLALNGTPGICVAGMFTDCASDGQVVPAANIDDLIAAGQRNEFDEVVISLAGVPPRRAQMLIDQLSVLPVDMWLCPNQLKIPIISTTLIGDFNLLHVKPKPIEGWSYVVKVAFDYIVGTFSLVLFAIPMLVIALAIKLDSPGPVFFRQRRHGFNHRIINVYKFRTMTVAEDGPCIVQAQKGDTRVTRIGRFLRKTSLDELPQLFNVLRGEMSLVGPRPHALAHNQQFRETLDNYANRHRVKPGITGWAQIHGFRGPTVEPDKMRRRVQMDLYYIENWSLWLDVKIILATPILGFVHPNAI